MQEQWAGSRGVGKKEMFISADDIPAAEEALHVPDSRRAGKTSSTAEWNSPMHTTVPDGRTETRAPRHSAELWKGLLLLSHLLHPQAPCGASQSQAGVGIVQTEVNSAPRAPKWFFSHAGGAA